MPKKKLWLRPEYTIVAHKSSMVRSPALNNPIMLFWLWLLLRADGFTSTFSLSFSKLSSSRRSESSCVIWDGSVRQSVIPAQPTALTVLRAKNTTVQSCVAWYRMLLAPFPSSWLNLGRWVGLHF